MEVLIGIALAGWVLYGVASALGKAGQAVTDWSNRPRPVKPRPYIPPPQPTRQQLVEQARKEYADDVALIQGSIPQEDQDFYLNESQAKFYKKLRNLL